MATSTFKVVGSLGRDRLVSSGRLGKVTQALAGSGLDLDILGPEQRAFNNSGRYVLVVHGVAEGRVESVRDLLQAHDVRPLLILPE